MVAWKDRTRWWMACIGVLLLGIFRLVAEAAEPVKVGVIGPMKQLTGEFHWEGAIVAADEINAAGGVNVGGVKRKIQLVKADSNEFVSVTDAASAMEKLLSVDKVDLVVGGVRSEAVMAMQEIMGEYKKIFIDSGSGHPELNMRVGKEYEKYKYYFRIVVDAFGMGTGKLNVVNVVARKLREELGIRVPKVAVLAEKAMVMDVDVAAANKNLPEMGMEIVGVWRPSPNATDVMAELSAISRVGADMIYVNTAGPVQHVISKQWGEQQIPAAMVGYIGVGDSSEHWRITGGMCNYIAACVDIAYVDATPRTKPFFDNYKKRFNRNPVRVALTYDAIDIWKDAVERAGTLDAEAVIASLEKTDFPGVQGRTCFYPKEHTLAHGVKVAPGFLTMFGIQWRDGERVVVWPDGKPVHPVLSKDPAWANIKYKGTVDYVLPPWIAKKK
jgi:branched-chain amino acid transport system substrate-binding protein